VIDPAGWRAAEVKQASIFPLDDGHIAELDAALASVERKGLAIEAITRADFPLDRLAVLMGEIRRSLMDGLGFVLMRNFPVERYSRRQAVAAYWGLGTYLGSAVMQNALGHMLGHVKDLGYDKNDPNYRNYHTSQDIDFHADKCDIVGLLCLQTAKAGGESRIVSSITVYNEMLKRRPDLVAEMVKPLYRDRRGEVPAGTEPWYTLPMFCFQDGYLSVRGGSLFVKSAQRFAEVPRLSPAQLEALDLLQELSIECSLDMDFRPGDIQFLHNHVILHARTEYEDWPDEGRKRHLLRLWLNTDSAGSVQGIQRPLTPEFAEAVKGVVIESVRPNVPLDAE
jgi:hypothetical protein